MLRIETKNLLLGLSLLMGLSACDSGKLEPLQRVLQVENGTKVALKIEQYCPANRYKDLIVVNTSYQIQNGEIKADSDADGVLDIKESNDLGLSAYSIDSNQDGYSDLYVFMTGMTLAAQGRLPANLNQGLDSDSDGLFDSDEILLELNHLNFDTDGDELPDGLEVRVGADARDKSDAILMPAGDKISNLDKIKQNLPLRETATEAMKDLAFRYKADQDDKGCYAFEVSNISVLTLPTGNQVRMYFIEEQADGVQVLQARKIFIPGNPKEGTVHTYTFEEEEQA